MSGKKERPLAGIVLFPQVEVLDFAGPYEVLSCAADDRGEACFKCLTVSLAPEVVCRGGLRVGADIFIGQAPIFDLLLVPGGPGARNPKGLEPLIKFIKEQAQAGAILASVCTGSFLLARAGLLQGLRATTHKLRLQEFAETFPDIQAVPEKIVDQGRIITAGGVSSGIDLALFLLEKFFGEKARRKEAVRLDGPWQ
jgi:transcriptional regulator GlxA family with amidase domain